MSTVVLYITDTATLEMPPTPTPTATGQGVGTDSAEAFTKSSKQPIRLNNYLTGEVHYDTLHQEAEKVVNILVCIFVWHV